MSKLLELFKYQRSLMEKLAPVEIELGYTPPPVPLDFTTRQGQDWFRLMSWYLQEEIVEASTATPENFPDELADCFHFAVELCILAEIDHSRIETILNLEDLEPYSEPFTMESVSQSLGLACNLLKMKHWKRNPQPTDMKTFQYHLMLMVYRLVMVARDHDLDFHEIYMKKHSVNENRIKDKY